MQFFSRIQAIRFAFLSTLIISSGLSFANPQLPAAKPAPIVGAKSLALSPDGAKIAFSYRGEIWVAPVKGGLATALTSNLEMNDYPIWSPDGKYIAFASNRYGNNSIYVVSAEGGPTQQLTYGDGQDRPSDWSPDGSQILFVDRRDNEMLGVYSVNVETGKTSRYFQDQMSLADPHFSPSGKEIFYTRLGEFPWTRPRYHGSGAAQIWEYDITTGKRDLIENNGFQHLWLQVGLQGEGVMSVSTTEVTPSSSPVGQNIGKFKDNSSRTPNIYWIHGGKKQMLTSLVGFEGTRFLSVSPSTNEYAYETGGKVFVAKGSEKPVPIAIRVSQDDMVAPKTSVVETTGATDGTLSPDKTTLAFVLNNDIWTVPVRKRPEENDGDAVQLTDWAGIDSDPLWLPGNKQLAFISDREGVDRIYLLDIATKKVIPFSTENEDASDLQLTPDKKSISYWVSGNKGGLYVRPIESGVTQKILDQTNPQQAASLGSSYSWSPDGKFVAYVQRLSGSGFQPWEDSTNILVKDITTGTILNVTGLSAAQTAPTFSPDGRFLFFVGDRDGAGIYALPLRHEDESIEDARLVYKPLKGDVKVVVDPEDISTRSRLITPGAVQGNLAVSPLNGAIYYLQANDLYRASYSGKGAEQLTKSADIEEFKLSEDGSNIFVIQKGNPGIITLRSGPMEETAPSTNAEPATVPVRRRRGPGGPPAPIAPSIPPAGGGVAVTPITFQASYVVDIDAQHLAAFNQFYRRYNSNFYDPNFHGRDWAAIKVHMLPLMSSVRHRNEMAILLNEMVGELESSHSEVGPAAGNPIAHPAGRLGVLFDYNYAGPGLKILSVPDRTPGSYSKTKLEPGDVITEINGEKVSLDENLWKSFTDKVGKEANLKVAGSKGTRDVKFRFLSAGQWNKILHENHYEAIRKYVEAKSGGKLTYVHIDAMDDPSLNRFKQEAWQYSQGKKGLIIDVRNNGGGNTADAIIDILQRYPHAIYQFRGYSPVEAPGQMLHIPLVVMEAQTSYSNAEMFPAAVKDAKLATLVGMPTPGYVIWTSGWRLVDGTSARMPGGGSYRLDGTSLEDTGVKPDVQVEESPEDYLAGKYDQVDAAIKVLLQKIGK